MDYQRMKTLVPCLDHRVIGETLKTLDCARALTVWILLNNNEFDQIVRLEFNPFDYNDLQSARDSLAATDLLRKHEDLPTSIDKDEVAFNGFVNAENVCKETNIRLAENHSRDALLLKVRRKIADVLGDFDPLELFELAGWGPGVTLLLKGVDATPTNKFRREGELTQPLYNLLKPIFGSIYPNWKPKFKQFEGNRVITVPKNAKTNRVIAVEPSLNLFFQKGVGAMIRRRLKRYGVDLRDQSRNHGLARLSSALDHLATVDFSAASDTISYHLIMELLPYPWFAVLDCLRSPRGLFKDSLIEYEKFSSMGNGFTFELESLIFWAIAKACALEEGPYFHEISIYGDDLVIPVSDVKTCYDAFEFFGFTVNKQKSYSSSYYRESCGGHFWNGVDITPTYLRRYLSNNREIYVFHNCIVKQSISAVAPGFRDKRFKGVCSLLFNSVKQNHRLEIPLGFGDGGFVRCFSQATPRFHRGYQAGFRTKHLSFEPCKVLEDDDAVLINALYSISRRADEVGGSSESSTYGFITIPRRGKWRRKTLYVPQWPCLGPWI